MPQSASNSVKVQFELAQGTRLEVTEDIVREFEAMALQELKGIKYSTVNVGGSSIVSSSAETNTSSVTFTH